MMNKQTYILILLAFWTNFVQSQDNPTYTPKLLTTATGVYLDNNDKPVITRDYNDSLVLAFTGIYSNDNVRNEVGSNPTYVSGTGLDAIYDFSVLSDNRLNKNAYLGNSFGLPEYWDFPWNDSIYYDSGNPYHWKLKDFHYRYLESMVYDADLSNCFFAKLTYSAEVLQSVDEIYIYNSSAADSSELLTYIGVSDYFGDELVVNGGFSAGTTGWNFTDCSGTVDDFLGKEDVLRLTVTNASTIYANSSANVFVKDMNYLIDIDYYIPSANGFTFGIGAGANVNVTNYEETGAWVNDKQIETTTEVGSFSPLQGKLVMYTFSASVGNIYYIDRVSVKDAYVNFYENEIIL